MLVIQEAAEMYLKTILRLQQSTGYVRSVDIAREINYSKPTVSEQMKKFRENDFITIEPDGQILLTDKGLAIAKRTLERHHVLTDILVKIGVDEKTAKDDACRIEHYISQQTFECLRKYFDA